MSSSVSTKFSQDDTSINSTNLILSVNFEFHPPNEAQFSHYNFDSIKFIQFETNQNTLSSTSTLSKTTLQETRFLQKKLRLGKSSRGRKIHRTMEIAYIYK